MEVIEKTPGRLVLRLHISEPLANALRRSVSEISTLAIDEVEIFKNDSALYDELLAHRLGLVPLKTEKAMSSKTEIDLKLSKTGPCTVYSGDLKGNAEIVYDKIPLTILGEGHKLEFVATAKLGKGIEHAKHIPGLCFYRHLLEVSSSAEIDEIVKASKCLIKSEKTGSKWLCDLREAEVDAINVLKSDAVTEAEEMLLIIESFGMMDAKDIFLKAIESLGDNLDEVAKELK
jgi:DNA-directed RNA polymerase alpha subunit